MKETSTIPNHQRTVNVINQISDTCIKKLFTKLYNLLEASPAETLTPWFNAVATKRNSKITKIDGL